MGSLKGKAHHKIPRKCRKVAGDAGPPTQDQIKYLMCIYIYIYIYSYIHRRSNHMSCQLNRIWPPTWLSFRCIQAVSITAAPGGLAWLSWPLWLAYPKLLCRDLSPSSSHLVTLIGKSKNSTRQRHQNLKIAFASKMIQNTTCSRPSGVQIVSRSSEQLLQSSRNYQRHLRASILQNALDILHHLKHDLSKLLLTSNLEPETTLQVPVKSPNQHRNCPDQLCKVVSATGPQRARLVRSTCLCDD